MRTRAPLIGGLMLLALSAAWVFAIAPRWTQRLPPGWSWQAEFIGPFAKSDGATGQFPATDRAVIYTRSMRLVSEVGRPGSVQVEDAYSIHDPATGQITWEYIVRSDVDPATGRHVTPALRAQSLVFPRDVQKQTYLWRSNYLKGVPMAFEGEQDIEGLRTYRFGYRGRGEYTESYAGSDKYAGVKAKAGEEIRCADDQFVVKVWVEPVTGEILRLQESCLSGDYLFRVADGRRLGAVLRWAGVTGGDDVLLRADRLRVERRRLQWLNLHVPMLMLAAAALLLGAAAVQWRRQAVH